MIGYLSGVVRGRVVLTGTGVGYVVNTPLPLVEGDQVDLHVSTVVREDAITLYAFQTSAELVAFEVLCKVSGVGPSSALAVVRDAGIPNFVAAVAAADPRRLGKVRGVGTKLAERIVKEAKIPDGLLTTAEIVDSEEFALVRVLIELGFDKGDALTAIGTTDRADGEDARLATALNYLRKGAR